MPKSITRIVLTGGPAAGKPTLISRILKEFKQDEGWKVITIPGTAAALLSGDRMTFDALRCEAPELRQLPVATYVWFEKNYLDRDYPLRFVLRCNGVQFPETLKKEP